MRVVVAVEGEATRRAAQSLASHPDVDVSLLGPTTSTQFDVVDTAAGFDAVVGADRAARAAAASDVPAVVTGELNGQPGIRCCSISGLALALAGDLGSAGTIAVAVPGEPGGDRTVVFPSPINARAAVVEQVADRTVHVARGADTVAAALATGRERHRVVLDDHRFMEAIALAAGVAPVLEGHVDGPVWEHSTSYLAAAADMGLVIGERASD